MPAPRHREIYAELCAQIRSGRLSPGAELPSEAALSRQWNVSRGPIRQALAELRADGLIVTSQGRPATVAPAGTQAQTLSSFTPFSRWAATAGRQSGSRTLRVGRVRCGPEVAAALHLDVDDFVVEIVRVRLLDGEPAMLERSRFTQAAGSALLDIDPDSGSLTDFLTARGVVFAAIHRQLDAVGADSTDAAALGIESGSPLLRERRTSRDDARTPFEYSEDRYRPDRVTFAVDSPMTPAF